VRERSRSRHPFSSRHDSPESYSDYKNPHSRKRRPYDDQNSLYQEKRSKMHREIFENSSAVWASSPERENISDDDVSGQKKVKSKKKKDVEIKQKKDDKYLSNDDCSAGSEEKKKKKKKKKHKKEKKSKQDRRSKKRGNSEDESEDVWTEKQVCLPQDSKDSKSSPDSDSSEDFTRAAKQTNSSDVIIGPMPELLDSSDKIVNFGHALLPGEGAAMAAYVTDGKRIPRRGLCLSCLCSFIKILLPQVRLD